MRRFTLFLIISIIIFNCSKTDTNKNESTNTIAKNTELTIPDSTVLEWIKVNKNIQKLVENYKYIAKNDSSNNDSLYKEIELKRAKILEKSSFGTIDSFLSVRKTISTSIKYDSLLLVNGIRIIK